MVAFLRKLWRSDLFGIFLFNLLGLVVALYISYFIGRLAFLSITIAAGNLLYLFILLVIRLRVLTDVVDMIREHPLQEVKGENKGLDRE
jgi:hypothetical protein